MFAFSHVRPLSINVSITIGTVCQTLTGDFNAERTTLHVPQTFACVADFRDL